MIFINAGDVLGKNLQYPLRLSIKEIKTWAYTDFGK